ncbi:MAG: SAM-dependent methyltransferase, partial [Ilumatobacteraceae bacterium]
MNGERATDPDRLKQYAFQLFSKLEGAVTAGMVHLGDQLGLYAAMRDAGTPLTTTELAQRAG